jgi:hypothetical protein
MENKSPLTRRAFRFVIVLDKGREDTDSKTLQRKYSVIKHIPVYSRRNYLIPKIRNRKHTRGVGEGIYDDAIGPK